jgi:hypothetical protein
MIRSAFGKGWLMEDTYSNCTYRAGDETCYRPDCPNACVRNYRDQLVGDLPLSLHANPPRSEHTPRQAKAGLWAWLTSLSS